MPLPLPLATCRPGDRLRRFDMPGPRYTPYPTADRFVEAVGAPAYRQALRQRTQGAVAGGAPSLSLYVHIPFCESLCCACDCDRACANDCDCDCDRACNKLITKRRSRGAGILVDMRDEIDLHAAEAGAARPMSQLPPMQATGLLDLSDSETQLTAQAWFFVQVVVMVFDRLLQADSARERFARII